MQTIRYTGDHTTPCPVDGCAAQLSVMPHYDRHGAPSRHIADVTLFDPQGRSWHWVCRSYEVHACAEGFARLHAEQHGA